MSTSLISRRSFMGGIVAAAGSGYALPASALCVSPKESGRWRNRDNAKNPAYIDVRMVDCGDQVLNGHQTSTRYAMRVWVRQSNGQYYGRPTVKAEFRRSSGQNWLYGRVPTGGYLDHVWIRATTHEGRPYLRVLIKHESLDSKPDASSAFWFTKTS